MGLLDYKKANLGKIRKDALFHKHEMTSHCFLLTEKRNDLTLSFSCEERE